MPKYKKLFLFLFALANIKASVFDRSYFYRASQFADGIRFEKPFLSTFDIGLTFGREQHHLFNIWELNLNYLQNFARGFFIHFHVPTAFIKNIRPCHDELQLSCPTPFRNSKTLKNLKDNKEINLEDTTLFVGWTLNYEGTEYLDFIDLTLRTGALFPTSTVKNRGLFDLPLGYNGHWGVPWSFDLAIGGYDWLTFGLHTDGVGFIDRNINGFKVSSKPVWRAGFYGKFDHFCYAMSLLLGFSFEGKNKDEIKNCQEQDLNKILNCVQLRDWSRSIFHLALEWDFNKDGRIVGPRVGFSYNKEISGEHTFNTSTVTGWLSLDVSWCF